MDIDVILLMGGTVITYGVIILEAIKAYIRSRG